MERPDRYQAAYDAQGFEEPVDESPVETPDGWRGGEVHQTGGMVMVRRWTTCEDLYRIHDERPGRGTEYEVAYDEQPGASLQRYEWDDEHGAYIFASVDAHVAVEDNTDAAKAEAALELMEDFER